MSKGNRFERGSGVYACRVCKRKTRSTGRGDNEHIGLCVECYDLSGEENSLSDNGELWSVAGTRECLKSLKAKGIDADNLYPSIVKELARLDAVTV